MTYAQGSVAIVGAADVIAPKIDESLESLIFSTARRALAEAEVDHDGVNAVVTACSDQVDGRAISSMLTTGAAGGHLRDEVNLASSGAHALILGYLQVASGLHDVVLVSSWGKASEGNVSLAEHLSADPYFDRDLPLTDSVAMAMQASAFRRQVTDGGQAAAAVVAKNRGESEAEVKASAVAASPLRQLEIAPPRDGACSFVLTSASNAARYREPVWIEGVGWSSDSYRLGDRDLVHLPHLRKAAEAALGRAGRRVDQIDFIEAHDYSADAELLAYSGLGLCDVASVPRFILDGSSGHEGSHPVNLSGGSLSGEVPFVGSLVRLGNLIRRLRNSGEDSQRSTRSGLLQASAGFAGQFQTVAVLSTGGSN